jgi:hypothetical protein
VAVRRGATAKPSNGRPDPVSALVVSLGGTESEVLQNDLETLSSWSHKDVLPKQRGLESAAAAPGRLGPLPRWEAVIRLRLVDSDQVVSPATLVGPRESHPMQSAKRNLLEPPRASGRALPQAFLCERRTAARFTTRDDATGVDATLAGWFRAEERTLATAWTPRDVHRPVVPGTASSMNEPAGTARRRQRCRSMTAAFGRAWPVVQRRPRSGR